MFLDRYQNEGLPGVSGVGVENSEMKIAVQTAGKAPVNSGTVTAGLPDERTAVVAAVVAVVTLNDGPFGNTLQNIFFGSVCGPEDGKQAGSMFSRGPGGAEDLREEILPKCPVAHDMHPVPCKFCPRGQTLSQTKVNEMQHFDLRVMAHIVASDHNDRY